MRVRIKRVPQQHKLNSRHWKHGDGGDMHIYNGGELPETTVTAYAPLRLTTHYPITSEYYPYTGHSELDIPIDRKTWYDYTGDTISSDRLSPYLTIDKTSSAKDYNLVTNNCADATLKYLNAAFGTSEKPWLFTTPGDVRDYALKKLNGKLIKNLDGSDTVLIPRNAKIAAKLSKTALNMFGSDKETAYSSLIGPFHRHGLGGNLFEDGGTKAGISVDYLDPSEVMPLVADNMGKSIVLDEQVVTPSKKLPMQSDLFEGITNQAANEKADEFVNKTIGNGEAFTPWGLSGLLINEGMGAIASALPESAQEVLAKGRYISPSYWIDRGTGLSDEQLMNGKGKLFGTGTGTMFDILSTKGIGKGANAAATEAANTFSKIRQLSRLEKNYTGVPHKELREAPGTYMDEVFPNNHTQHTIWSTDDIDYPRTFDGPDRTVYDVYTDPKELSILETPSIPEDKMLYWQGLPFKLENGKVSFADNLSSEQAWIPRSKDISLKKGGIGGNYTPDEVASYIMKDGENGLKILDWKKAPGTISTDDVVKYSLDNGYDATKFNRVFDGASEIDGTLYDYPINELVLNPNTPRYVLPHGTSKLRLWNQLPTRYSQSNYFASKLPYTTLFRNYINNE